MTSNTRREVTGSKMVASGLCLARTDDGEIVFVEGLLPEEQADVRVETGKGKTLFGEIVERVNSSNIRVDPPCPNVKRGCGGCDWQHIDVASSRDLKRDIVVDALSRVGKVGNAQELTEACTAFDSDHYRTSAKILVSAGKWGYRARHTHDMVSVNECMVLHQELALQAQDAISLSSGSSMHEAHLRRAPDPLYDRPLSLSSRSFFQSHIDAPRVLVDLVKSYVNEIGENLTCVDLYSGVGIFAMGLALDEHRVIAVESNQHAVKDATKNLKGLSAEVIHKNVDNFIFDYKTYQHCDVVVADPSRDGLGPAGVETVLDCEPTRVVLISCDPASGARDIKALIENDYVLKSVVPLDMFSYTHHVEMVSILDKV